MVSSPKTYAFEDPRLRRVATDLLSVSTQYAIVSRRIDADIDAITRMLAELGVEAVQCEVIGTHSAPGGRMCWDPERAVITFGGGPGLEVPLRALPLRTRQACHAQLESLLEQVAQTVAPADWRRLQAKRQ